jgi:hypothetical protein
MWNTIPYDDCKRIFSMLGTSKLQTRVCFLWNTPHKVRKNACQHFYNRAEHVCESGRATCWVIPLNWSTPFFIEKYVCAQRTYICYKMNLTSLACMNSAGSAGTKTTFLEQNSRFLGEFEILSSQIINCECTVESVDTSFKCVKPVLNQTVITFHQKNHQGLVQSIIQCCSWWVVSGRPPSALINIWNASTFMDKIVAHKINLIISPLKHIIST